MATSLYDLTDLSAPTRRMGMVESDPEYDPWELQAAAVRRRAPTRIPDPDAAVASGVPGAVRFSNLPGFDEARRQATNVYLGEDYDPSSLVQMAMGAVGAPGAVGGVPAGVLGAGIVRRPPIIPAGAGKPPVLDPATAKSILEQTLREGGGSSTNILTGQPPPSGLMMGIYSNEDPRNLVLPSGQALSLLDLENFARKNRGALSKPDRYLGTWAPEHGTYLDVSQRFDPEELRKATKFGERTGQEAGYNVGTKQTFPVGNWYQFIEGPEYHQRLREMAEKGNEYLKQFPAKEWWDMHNSAFERVYGQENLPQVAGFTASTAPNTAPVPNLQQMSEYMRRHITGEPIVQPDWRVPEGAMTNQPGGKMPMEAARVANLERTQRGALDELSRAKVREEAAAMMGDPNAVVIDRHQVRLAEKPEAGIFASGKKDFVDSEPPVGGASDYDRQQAQIMDEAYKQGRTPRDFSADAWTGIRETVKHTNELYGQKYRGSAITGESASYADQFDSLLARKAQHLGISQSELEKRLRGGDANLMSWLLATTPAAAEAYRQWRSSQGRSGAASSDKSQQSSGDGQTSPDAL